MPRVPVYQEQTRLGQVRQPQATAPSAEAFMGGARQTGELARALGNAGDGFDRIAQREATTEAFAAEAEIKKQWLDFSSQLQKNRQGMGAKGVTAEVEKWWTDTAPKFLEGAKNGLSQRMIQQSAQRMQLAAMGEFQGFENRQLEVAADQAFDSNIRASYDSILNNPTPDNIALHRAGITAAIRQQALTKGWATEVVNERTNAAMTAAAQSAFNGVLRTMGPLKANEFLTANADQFPAALRGELTEKVKPLVAAAKGEEFAASVAGMPLDKQVELAQKITDPDERKAAVAQVRQNEELKALAVRAREQQASDTIWQMVGQGMPMRALPKDVLLQMDGRERTALADHYRAQAERAKSEAAGKPVQTDFGVYERLVNLPAEEFLQVRLSTFQDKLSRGDLEKLIDRQAKLRNPKEAGDVATSEQQMGTYATMLELKGEKKGMFQNAAYNEFEQFRKINKREPGYKERQEILDRLTMQSDGGWFGSSYRMFEKPATQEARTQFVEQVVPEKDRKEIVDALKAAGRPVTVENILDAYRLANPK